MKYTSKYNLNKPESTDYVNIEDLNENMDILDEELSVVENNLDEHLADIATNSHKISNITGLETTLGEKATTTTYTATLNTTWNGSEPPYSNVQAISGVKSTDTPVIDVVMSGTFETDKERQENWGYIYRAVTGANQVAFYASEKPGISLPIQLKVVR